MNAAQKIFVDEKSLCNKKYYVYEILHMGDVCYVGKGIGDRVLQHFKSGYKSRIACYIKLNPSQFDYRIVDFFQSEAEALLFEKNRIKSYKRDGVILLNIVHNKTTRLNWLNISRILSVLKRMDGLLFSSNDIVFPLKDKLQILQQLISEIIQPIHKSEIPFYKGIRMDLMKLSVVTIGGKQKMFIHE